MTLPRPPQRPCGSCPYRCDVPPGVWSNSEYAKLPPYDEDTPYQPPHLFMCHQRSGDLCGGWLQAHDPAHLLALRLRPVDPSAYGYTSDVPCFASGTEAALHGMQAQTEEARDMVRKLDPVVTKRRNPK